MMPAKLKPWLPVVLLIHYLSLSGQDASFGASEIPVWNTTEHTTYWKVGTAELNTYSLYEIVNGESLEGEMTLVYALEVHAGDETGSKVTEHQDPSVLLKLSQVKKLQDGILEKRVMTNIFTPCEAATAANTRKVVYSSQDWEGQHYSRLDFSEGVYTMSTYSPEKGKELQPVITAAIPEEDVWTRLRIDPLSLPMGSFDMTPALECVDRNLAEPRSYAAIGKLQLQITADHQQHYIYQINFPELGRRVEWRFEAYFPYMLLNWEEKITIEGREFKSSAVLTKTMRTSFPGRKKNENAVTGDSQILRLN